jgi:hypothetical protein
MMRRTGLWKNLICATTAVALAGCSTLRGDLGLEDKSAVQTPVFTANKVLFLQSPCVPSAAQPCRSEQSRFGNLMEGYQLAADAQAGTQSGLRRAVRNRQPLSIVISRAYVPASLKSCNARASDILYPKGRDIAVLLDVSTASDREDFIAVWYQRDVPPDALLTFQDLLVYSSDAWDAKFPPYFRLRLVDVSSERNTALGGLLEQVRSNSSAITGLLGAPGAAPIVGIASLAARQVLAHDKNKALVDFTFQLYGEHLLAESGGMPLGVLQTGGMVVTAPPCGAGNTFWNNDLRFDHRLNRITDTANGSMAMPYVLATILTADLSVPQIVRTRSAAIMKRLTDPQVVQSELKGAYDDAGRLMKALEALDTRETFRRRPTKESFATMVTGVTGDWNGLDSVEQGFFLDAFYQITGVSLADGPAYQAWATNCLAVATFNTNSGRFDPKPGVVGKDNKPCWPI